MNKSTKIFKKAMKYYYKGNIDKALELCEKSVNVSFKNSAALNMKGLLYYFKGNLAEAKRSWEVNYKGNGDEVSKKYIKDARGDIEKKEQYKEALNLIKKLKINDATKLLEQCVKSHYNCINVNNHLASCYIKQGKYDSALECINEVLRLDRKNTMALQNKKMLIEFRIIKREYNYKKLFKGAGMASAAIVVVIMIGVGINKFKNIYIGKTEVEKENIVTSPKKEEVQEHKYDVEEREKFPGNIDENVDKKEIEEEYDDVKVKKEEIQKDETKKAEIQEEIKEEKEKIQETKDLGEYKIIFDELEYSINNRNMNLLYEKLQKVYDKSSNEREKSLINKAEKIMREEGIFYFYDEGRTYFKDENYKKAIEYFIKALPYSKGEYVHDNALYHIGRCFYKINDMNNMVKYYDQYIKEYPQGDYVEDVLYELVVTFKEKDINLAKKYAQIIVSKYSDSQYNNPVTKSVLEK